jgi:hypothetical protein
VARSPASKDLPVVVAIVVVMIGVCLGTYFLHGYRFPIGPDAPAYIWWTRLAGHDGLSSAGGRAGAPALVMILSGALGQGPAVVVTALEIVLASAAGLAAAAFVAGLRGPLGGRGAQLLAGLLTGMFALHLAAGYVANLSLATMFLAALVLLGYAGRRRAIGAALMVGAGGLALPTALPFTLAVLGLTGMLAFLARRHDPSVAPVGGRFVDTEYGRIAGAAGGGIVLCALGLIALRIGPPALAVDTSRDDFLIRAGLRSTLPALFRGRLMQHWARYAPIVAIPLAVWGGRATDGYHGRVLRAWGCVVLTGIAVGLIWGGYPPERIAMFALCIPIAAALGLIRARRLLIEGPRARRRVAAAVGTGVVAAMVVPAVFGWYTTPTQLFPSEVDHVTQAGRYASASAPGTPLVFLVSGRTAVVSLFAINEAEVVRAAMPPDRIRDVYVVVPGVADRPPGPSAENRRFEDVSWRDAYPDGVGPNGVGDPAALGFDLQALDRTGFDTLRTDAFPDGGSFPRPRIVTSGVGIVDTTAAATPRAGAVDPLADASPWRALAVTLAMLLVAGAVGLGWSRWAMGPGAAAVAIAPACGLAAALLVCVVFERLGVPVAARPDAAAVLAVTTVAGYLMASPRWVLDRRGPA